MAHHLWRPCMGRRALAVLGVVSLLTVPAGLLRHHPATVAHADAPVVFVVNGIPESLGEWKTALALAQRVSPVGTSVGALHAQVFESMKEGFATLAAARAQGVSINDQDVDTLVVQQQLTTASPDGAALVQQLAQAAGVSTDQFWSYARPYYASALAIAKLRVQYEGSLGAISDAEKAARWQSHLQDLVRTAKVEINNPTAVQ